MNKQPPSRKSAFAGAIAGFIAAGIGAWYLTQHNAEAQQAKPAAPQLALAAPSRQAVSREQAALKLMALPELKTWSERIEQRSGGKLRGALIEYDPRPREVAGQPYYQFNFVENGEDAAQALASFLVSHASGAILVEDDISGELLSLDKWRQSLKE